MLFTSRSIEEHAEVPKADDGRWEEIVQHWQRRGAPAKSRETSGTACYVLSLCPPGGDTHPDRQLAEIVALVGAQGDRVVARRSMRIWRIDPRCYLSSGIAAQIAEEALGHGADMLVVDAELSPSQMRNLEDAMAMPVCDREAVILNVFLLHARTKLARTQVEIAHLEYLRPRIRGLGLDMDQQAGGMMNARGPGETASELLGRRLDGRLVDLKRALSRLRQAGEMQRSRRSRAARIALVGYTNAGKTSLMNGLTAAGLSARDMPFETLDTTSRSLTRHGGDVVISDTVGFIRRLPSRLLASFESTLAEVQQASLVVVVVDASDPEWTLHVRTTHKVLERLGVEGARRFYVFNKCDQLAIAPTREDVGSWIGPHSFATLTARDADAVSSLKERLVREVRSHYERLRVFVPYEASDIMNLIHRRCERLCEEASERGIRFTVSAPPDVAAQLQAFRRRAREGSQR